MNESYAMCADCKRAVVPAEEYARLFDKVAELKAENLRLKGALANAGNRLERFMQNLQEERQGRLW